MKQQKGDKNVLLFGGETKMEPWKGEWIFSIYWLFDWFVCCLSCIEVMCHFLFIARVELLSGVADLKKHIVVELVQGKQNKELFSSN